MSEDRSDPEVGKEDVNPVTGKAKSKRGFASMSPERRREIQSMGGKSVPAEKRFYAQEPGEARVAGRKGRAAQGKDTK